MAEKRLSVIVFGATGFTGKWAALAMNKFAKEDSKLTWGIAGRSEQKMKSLITELEQKTGDNFGHVKLITADIKNHDSLIAMTAKAQVIVNCCGPYRFLGEPVIKACVETGTHHVDVSGEPQYMERMQLEYDGKAKDKSVYIVSACGFDSIPADLGTIYLQNKFDGTLNSVETYLSSKIKGDESYSGASVHYTTYESAVYGLAHADELRPLRTKLYPQRLPEFKPKLRPRSVIHRNPATGRWSVPFPGSDRSVVMRSQRWFYDNDKTRPAQMQAYVCFPSLFYVLVIAFFGGIFSLLCRFEAGRSILLRFPKIFSGGAVSHEGPSEKKMENTYFSIIFVGEGWKEKKNDATDQFTEPTNKTVIAKVSGMNPGYGLTGIALVLSALTIVKHSDKMPGKGGVYPPGAAFAKTPLIEDLNANGMNFEIVSTKENTSLSTSVKRHKL